jgi:hypothetical protein
MVRELPDVSPALSTNERLQHSRPIVPAKTPLRLPNGPSKRLSMAVRAAASLSRSIVFAMSGSNAAGRRRLAQ